MTNNNKQIINLTPHSITVFGDAVTLIDNRTGYRGSLDLPHLDIQSSGAVTVRYNADAKIFSVMGLDFPVEDKDPIEVIIPENIDLKDKIVIVSGIALAAMKYLNITEDYPYTVFAAPGTRVLDNDDKMIGCRGLVR